MASSAGVSVTFMSQSNRREASVETTGDEQVEAPIDDMKCKLILRYQSACSALCKLSEEVVKKGKLLSAVEREMFELEVENWKLQNIFTKYCEEKCSGKSDV